MRLSSVVGEINEIDAMFLFFIPISSRLLSPGISTIKTAADAHALSKISDGVVIGSVLVEMINQQSEKKDYKKIYNYLNEISEAINP